MQAMDNSECDTEQGTSEQDWNFDKLRQILYLKKNSFFCCKGMYEKSETISKTQKHSVWSPQQTQNITHLFFFTTNTRLMTNSVESLQMKATAQWYLILVDVRGFWLTHNKTAAVRT